MKNATDEIVTDPSDAPIYVKNEDDFIENYFQTASAPDVLLLSLLVVLNGLAVAVIDHGADYEIALNSAAIVAELDGFAAPVLFSTTLDGAVIGDYQSNCCCWRRHH